MDSFLRDSLSFRPGIDQFFRLVPALIAKPNRLLRGLLPRHRHPAAAFGWNGAVSLVAGSEREQGSTIPKMVVLV